MKNYVINLHKQHEKIICNVVILSSKMTWFFIYVILMT